ncbi:DUF1353 domain-containing protein [Amnibacterium flavum]|uniref:DUF1353 domain-containing protein n=1 Tax=Amnibacterium flavum TaxID=2173173 RepID=A0A2V1HM40_9MICO|nr:DUF1353 domain-containing protein [Amnibacterium flavum]PVZ93598.1 hypothetical protein DDQ50_14920 [Amnibacterium flavum]
MPFARADGRRLDRIQLSQRAPGTFQLLEPFTYLEPGRPEAERITVRAHDQSKPAKGANATDLASVPPFLWGLISSHGRHTAPALLHDQLWWESLNPDPVIWIEQRRRADALFRRALREGHTSAVRASLMFGFVSLERYWGPRPWQAILMSTQIGLGIALVYASVLGLFGWWGFAVALVPVLGALAWRRDVEPMFTLTYLGVVLAPFALVAIVGQFLLALLEIAGWFLSGSRGPRPRRGPVGLTRQVKVRARRRVRDRLTSLTRRRSSEEQATKETS